MGHYFTGKRKREPSKCGCFIPQNQVYYINLKRGSDISSGTSIMATCTRNGNFSITANNPYTTLGEAIERKNLKFKSISCSPGGSLLHGKNSSRAAA